MEPALKCTAGHAWCKAEPVVPSDGEKHYCVFHAPEEHKGISVEEFNKLVFQRLDDAFAKDKLCDLSGTVFAGDIYFSSQRKLPSVFLIFAKFGGKVGFSDTNFGKTANFMNAKFRGDASFERATFGEDAWFFLATFGQNANFGGATFGEANFGGATFGENAVFTSATFGENANFNHATFGENADFNHATFGENANFGGATFNGDVKLGAKFDKNVDFYEAKFNGHVRLGAKFKKAHFLGDTFLGTADFKGLTVEDEARFKGVDFSRVLLDGAELDRMRFEHCTWDETANKVRIIIKDETKDNDDEKIKQVEEIYRTLKQKYKEMHNEGMASLFHVSEKLMLTRRTRIKDNPFYWLTLNAYRYSSGYGESPSRAVFYLLLFLMISVVAFSWAGIATASNGQNAYFISPILYISSVATATLEFLTLQRDSAYTIPATNPFGRIVRVFVFLFVYIQTLLFVFALRNKLRR